jgi:hypothetical protein
MEIRAYRAAMVSGIVFPILLVVGTGLILGAGPDTSKGSAARVAQAWVNTINDKGDRTKIIIGSFVVVVSALALVWFAMALRNRFARPGNPMFGFALLAAIGLIGGIVGPLAVAGGHSFGGEPTPTDGTAIWMVNDLAFPFLLVIFGLASAAFIAALLLTSRGSLPTWLVVFGWLAALAGVLGVLFLPMIILLLWYLVIAIYGLVRAPAADSTATA